MQTTAIKIITAAKECFFQHGFSAANVSLISRYAGISRATIYKNFNSKEAIFRAVVSHHFQQYKSSLAAYAASEKAFWLETESLILSRCADLFDGIPNQLIRSELKHVGQSCCEDIIQTEQKKVQSAIKTRLQKEIVLGTISLENLGITIDEFAQLLEAAPISLAFSNMVDDHIKMIKQMFCIFRTSCQ
ncbi:TetR/AcrR family transcriptional regulator [Colwellia sp. MEBiC06753]